MILLQNVVRKERDREKKRRDSRERGVKRDVVDVRSLLLGLEMP